MTPESGGSPNADQIHSLYVVVLIIAAVIFFGVAGTLAFFLARYRGRRGRVASQIHGNTQLRIVNPRALYSRAFAGETAPRGDSRGAVRP